VLVESNPALSWTGIIVVGLGLLIILLALRQYNLAEFSGLDAFRKREGKGGKLAIHGLSGRVRHPLYTGMLLVLWGFWFYDSTLSSFIMALFLSGYIRIGIYFEERKLIREFGNEYRNYQKQVPMLFPTIIQ
jgi:protein-S-isoprenylcysteine O-methyltransferase Ste14